MRELQIKIKLHTQYVCVKIAYLLICLFAYLLICLFAYLLICLFAYLELKVLVLNN
jgi:hypothetical protein